MIVHILAILYLMGYAFFLPLLLANDLRYNNRLRGWRVVGQIFGVLVANLLWPIVVVILLMREGW